MAPNTFVMELGLDSDVAPRSDGKYPIIQCLARQEPSNPTGWVPAWATEFRTGDTIAFRVFDYTMNAERSRFDLKGLFIRFLDPAQPQYLSSCLNENPIYSDRGYSRFPTPSKSLVVPDAPGWSFGDSAGGEVFFTFDRPARSLLVVNVVTTYQAEQGSYELRHFGHDPEIFVGEGDPPPPPPPPHGERGASSVNRR